MSKVVFYEATRKSVDQPPKSVFGILNFALKSVFRIPIQVLKLAIITYENEISAQNENLNSKNKLRF